MWTVDEALNESCVNTPVDIHFFPIAFEQCNRTFQQKFIHTCRHFLERIGSFVQKQLGKGVVR